MAVKYSKFFTVIGAITNEPVTILVELVEAEGSKNVFIESVEGEYKSAKDFDEAYKSGEEKIRNFIPMMVPDVQNLVNALTEALVASEVV